MGACQPSEPQTLGRTTSRRMRPHSARSVSPGEHKPGKSIDHLGHDCPDHLTRLHATDTATLCRHTGREDGAAASVRRQLEGGVTAEWPHRRLHTPAFVIGAVRRVAAAGAILMSWWR